MFDIINPKVWPLLMFMWAMGAIGAIIGLIIGLAISAFWLSMDQILPWTMSIGAGVLMLISISWVILAWKQSD